MIIFIYYDPVLQRFSLYCTLHFSAIVSHGFTVDEEGRKMSKSIRNVLDPLDLVHGNNIEVRTYYLRLFLN